MRRLSARAIKGHLSNPRFLRIAAISIFMGFLGALTAFSVFSDNNSQPSSHSVLVYGDSVSLCHPGDELSHTVLTPDPEYTGYETPWMAAQAMAKGVRDAADKSEYSAKMRETLAPARAFAFDEDSKNNLTGLDNQKIITYDSTQLNDDGETVLTARIFVDEHSNGSFVSEMFICTSETYTSLSAFRQASSEFYGQIPSGGND